MGRLHSSLRPGYLGPVALFAAALLPPAPVAAGPPAAPVLSLAVTRAAPAVAMSGSPQRPPAALGLLTLLPSQLEIPDGYELDEGRRVPAFAAPVDRDRLVGVDLNGRRWHGWTASLNLDEETERPVGSTGTQLSVVFEHRF